jgi:hypothetical protein
LLQPKKDDILSKKKYSEVGKGNAKEKYEKALSVAENSSSKLKEGIGRIAAVYEECKFNNGDYDKYRELESFTMLGLKETISSSSSSSSSKPYSETVTDKLYAKMRIIRNDYTNTFATAKEDCIEKLIYSLKGDDVKENKLDAKGFTKKRMELLKKIQTEAQIITATLEMVQSQLKLDEIIMSADTATVTYSSAISAVFQKNMQKYIAAFIKTDDLITKAIGDLENAIKATEKYLEV